MRISLIEARPATYNVFQQFVIPRLGLPIMAAMLKNKGHDVRVYVPQLDNIWQHGLEILKSDLIGISSLTPSAPDAYDMARWIHRIAKVTRRKIPVVIGGPHVSFLPDEGLDYADYVVRGEGEHTMAELVDVLQGEGSLADVRGLSYREGDQKHHNPDRPLEPDLDKLPFADFSLVAGSEKLKHIPVATSRGCPHDCDFCSVVSMFGRQFRRRSNGFIMRELEEHLLPIGKRIFFVDDNFAGKRRAAKELLGMMKQRNLGRRMRWYTQVTVHAARDAEMLDLMRDTNCTQVYVGLESVNAKALKNFNKSQTVTDIENCVRQFNKRGIRVHGMFVLGADADTVETIEATVDFAKKRGINTAQFSILTPLPGTHTIEKLDQRLFTRDWGLYDGFHVVYEPAAMSMYQLQKAAMEAWRQFYSAPSYINAFMHFRLATGILRYYGRRIVISGLDELEDYLNKLRPMEALAKSI